MLHFWFECGWKCPISCDSCDTRSWSSFWPLPQTNYFRMKCQPATRSQDIGHSTTFKSEMYHNRRHFCRFLIDPNSMYSYLAYCILNVPWMCIGFMAVIFTLIKSTFSRHSIIIQRVMDIFPNSTKMSKFCGFKMDCILFIRIYWICLPLFVLSWFIIFVFIHFVNLLNVLIST